MRACVRALTLLVVCVCGTPHTPAPHTCRSRLRVLRSCADDMMQLGINQTLGKPVSKEEVEAVIKKWLGQSIDASAIQAPAQPVNDQCAYIAVDLPACV